ncbi:MAG: MMPL family transporter [Solirubrobacterales bacterium]
MIARAVAWVARRPWLVLGAMLALTAGAVALAAATLRPSSSADTLIGRSTATWQATERFHERFGDDAIYVLVREDLRKLLLTRDLETVLGLEGCLAGNPPADAQPPGGADGPCGRLAQTKPVQVVYGPGTFVNESVRQIGDQFDAQSQQQAAQADQAAQAASALARKRGYSAARARRFGRQARQLVQAQYTRDVLALALKYGLTGVPQLNDTSFVAKLVFADEARGRPKPRFAYLFPDRDSALIQVRLKPDLGDAARRAAIADIRAAVAMAQWRLSGGGRYVTTGAPVVLSDLGDTLSHSLLVLLVAALIVMAVVLAVVFRTRLRLLPLVVALCAAGLTFGALALTGLPLTMASIGVLPVLIGLAVDYAIQFQSRAREESRRPAATGDRLSAPDAGGAVVRAARVGAPAIVTAGAATAAGFLVLGLSPVPMVREFGLLLVVGVVLGLLCALTVGAAALVVVGRRPVPVRGVPGALAAAARGADELLRDNPLARGLARAGRGAGALVVGAALRRGRWVVAVAVVAALAGWALETQLHVQSDVNRLVPQDLRALTDLRELQQSTGVGGEIDVMVAGDDLTDPAVISWMAAATGTRSAQKRFGWRSPPPWRCGGHAVPGVLLPDLFAGGAGDLTRSDVRALLDAVPPYFSQAVITPDEGRRRWRSAFGSCRSTSSTGSSRRCATSWTNRPGVTAELVGLPVIAAQANAAVSRPWRRVALLVGSLLAVALVLLVALRSVRRALVPLVPIALATGWSALVLFVLRVDLNPMSVTLGALVVAITTEFSVLLSERYRQERAGGRAPRAALERTYRSTGVAVLASAILPVTGFAVLIVSDIQMLRDFGWVTVIDLAVALLGVLVVLPAVLVAAERGRAPARRARRRPREEALVP